MVYNINLMKQYETESTVFKVILGGDKNVCQVLRIMVAQMKTWLSRKMLICNKILSGRSLLSSANSRSSEISFLCNFMSSTRLLGSRWKTCSDNVLKI